MPDTDVFDVRAGENITLTTAATNAADGFPFVPKGSRDTAIVTRGGAGGSMLTNVGTLTLGKIILDGAKDTYTVSADGGLVNSTGALCLTSDTTLRNSSTGENCVSTIRQIRMTAGLSQKAFAESIGVSQSAVG